MRNAHIAENFKPKYSEVVKSYSVGNRTIEEKLEFQVVSMDENSAHVWVRDVSLNQFSSWIISTKRFLERVGEIKPAPELSVLNEQMRLFA